MVHDNCISEHHSIQTKKKAIFCKSEPVPIAARNTKSERHLRGFFFKTLNMLLNTFTLSLKIAKQTKRTVLTPCKYCPLSEYLTQCYW